MIGPVKTGSVFVVLMLCFFLTAGPGWAQEKKKRPPAPVQVEKAAMKMVSKQLSIVGTVRANSQSIVAAEVSGLVAVFSIKEGDRVKKDDVLARLKYHALELELNGQKAEKLRIRANFENAEKELERVKVLKARKSVAEKKYDNALYGHRALLHELDRAQAQIDALAYRITQKQVKAPFSGFIATEHTQVGQWLQPGSPVVTMVDISKVKVTVDVPERYISELVPKDAVDVVIKSVSGSRLSGRIDAILPQGNAVSRTFPVKIILDNPGFKIKSGMEAVATFNLASKQNALVVPKDAVVTAGENKLVYKVENKKASPVPVTVMGYYKGGAVVKGPLKTGDVVVVRGNERLRPGQPVAVIN